jgi:subtilisin family serine protease
MFAKARDSVNAVRSEFASAMAIRPSRKKVEPEETRVAGDVATKALATPAMKEVSDSVEVNAFVWHFTTPSGDGRPTRKDTLETKTVKLSELPEIAETPDVAYIELGEALKRPDAQVSRSRVSAPSRTERNIEGRDSGGRDVLIGIIDVGGFDFSHPDFLNAEGTRWLSIWDQREGGARPPPADFGFGSEILQEHMNAAIRAAPDVHLPAWALEPQSQMQVSSHGTHVASIAAGNKGICRNAHIAGVLIDLPDEIATDRRKSFYDSTRVAQAATYLCNLAARLGVPVSINVSLGTNGGGHDASNGASRWIDNELALPGRCVCVAAGNAGQEAASGPDDVGFIMGRIHTSGRIDARGLASDIEWVVVGNGIADVSENELEIWYSGADRFAVSITPPDMPTIGPIQPQEYVQNLKLPDGSMLSAYNELYHPANGCNYIAIYLSPFLKQNPVVGVRPGLWRVRLHGVEIRDGRYDGWIERDDPRPRGAIGPREFWNFPSFFTVNSNVDNSSVSSLACGARIVSVANLDFARDEINKSSSQGPTRDERLKPDVAAPGTDIVAANGFAGENDGDWIAMTGTSMASPYVAGVIGLMLEAEPKLTAAQICGIIQRTSNPLPGNTFEWADDAGYGVLNGAECVKEARALTKRVRLEP